MASFPNIWTHRKVADTASKPCEICYKPSASVLITPENKDFFYVCPSHLKDKGFATPIIDEAAIAAKKKKELDDEIERVKQEFEEKQKKKKEEDTSKKDDKEKDSKDKNGEGETDEKKTDEKKKSDTLASSTQNSTPDEEPRVFSLKKMFYQQRLDKKKQAEIARRNRERFQNPNLFPQVPKGLP
ncbi:hypothetical protein SS1G_03963 [Sclerotinia sclerotiorum 1980 UF-70]|uniref:DUF1742-domain-containing protein n=2 Tax=Sclerotinia sclerotiorum (strain ATCC 18683 / 1980 / Ss-1) TaxID=665079 RepID=A7EF72_SCLS1|nr:hypothetical protein SS1G_03963 [Sclerotinia sclerotiorum 1980 UF-70]APA12442.1 hypothetical protein sscle_09g072120 [Sclerotinia sclerotiorum 1980 UF-70]EDO01488.1 hypothetical protein SS1G_03963 [Sclerotinia sclerotiorum 1980 UF-70]